MKLLSIGCGAVCKSLFELLHIIKLNTGKKALPLTKLTIIDPELLPEWNSIITVWTGVEPVIINIALTHENINQVVSPLLNDHDFVVDLSVNVDSLELVKICKTKGVNYVNTSVENFDILHPEKLDPKTIEKRLLYNRMMEAHAIFNRGSGPKPTMVLNAGMNPGLVQHFSKKCIYEIVTNVLRDANLGKMLKNNKWGEVCKLLNVKTIHVSEVDTQECVYKRPKGWFINTWSANGLISEGQDPVQVSTCNSSTLYNSLDWKIPAKGIKNIKYLHKRGMDVKARTYCPLPGGKTYESVSGFIIPHSENDTLAKFLKVGDYYPDVYYVYHPSKIAIQSLNALKRNGYKALEHSKVLSLGEIKSGYDAVGALLFLEKSEFFSENIGFWSGTLLSSKAVTEMGFKVSNATCLQVSAPLLSTIKWILKHKTSEKLLSPEDLPYSTIIKDCEKYLGEILFTPIKYNKLPTIL
jgi:homospermidine synthase